ncbi:isoamylase early set domain-containing protein [Streptomyces halobius]|uniref:Isoamylase early set domain-containing protein n=1 Tax=Streptomyces halobius TaxID=2879846 RepID=A0ABY4M093_9ACTN|nr:isoamylase early set domain-containing protein [Streptomyces halobius]UQA91175.1 isoamylase early set domain-containing protein [Streptomyces halobius]
MLKRMHRSEHTEVTFVIPADKDCGPVSVVGDFNDWRPGAHPFVEQPDGSMAVTMRLPNEQRYGFRYLAHGNRWFDEGQADGRDGCNSILHT